MRCPQEVEDRFNAWMFEHVARPAHDMRRTFRSVGPKVLSKSKAKAKVKPGAKGWPMQTITRTVRVALLVESFTLVLERTQTAVARIG